jgi:hypothetical protein
MTPQRRAAKKDSVEKKKVVQTTRKKKKPPPPTVDKKKKAAKKKQEPKKRQPKGQKKAATAARADDGELLRQARENLRMKFERLKRQEMSGERREEQQIKLLQHLMKNNASALQPVPDLPAVAKPEQPLPSLSPVPSTSKTEAPKVESFGDSSYLHENSWTAEALSSAPLDESGLEDTFMTPLNREMIEMINPEFKQKASDAVTSEEVLNMINSPIGKKLLSDASSTASNDIKKYLAKYKDADQIQRVDLSRGIRVGSDNSFKMGASEVSFSGRKIIIDGQKSFDSSKGLLELIFMKRPDLTSVTNEDLKNYKVIIDLTNVYRRYYSRELPLAGSKSFKYTKIVSQLLKNPSGEGYGETTAACPIEYVWFHTYDEAVSRLRLLIAAREAGGNGHSAEISSIIKCLRKAGIVI